MLGLHSTMGERPAQLAAHPRDRLRTGQALRRRQTTLTEAEALAEQSGIPSGNLTLIEEKEAYAHNDPAGATPADNEFFKKLVPFLKEIA